MQVDHLEAVLGDVVITVYEGEYDEEKGEYSGPGVARLDNECLYEGEFLKGLFHGKGKYTWANGMTYEGDFSYNKMTGSGTYTYLDGSTYTGHVFNGKRHGHGKLITSGGQTYEGEWKDGKRHGTGKFYYNDEGNYVFSGEWVENLRHGYGTMKYPSGNHFEGEWKNDQKNGYGIMIWRDLDEVYTGNWVDDKPHGYGEHIWGDSSAKTIKKQNCNIYRGNYEDGKRCGFGTFFYMNGSQYSGQWREDMKEGPGIFIYPDGRIVAGNYYNNRLVQSMDEEFNNQRVTEDINPQYHLNLLSIFNSYPLIEYNPLLSMEEREKGQKKIISDCERLLLKYNSYIKTTYRHYNELNNKQRLREIPYIPPIEQIFSSSIAISSILSTEERNRFSKFLKSTVNARIINKRFYCFSLEFMIRFFREISLINEYYNCYDVVKMFCTMKEDQLTVSIKQYSDLLQMMINEKNRASVNASPSNNGTDTEAISVGDNNGEELEQGSQADSVSSLLSEVELKIGRLLDDYQEIYGFDPNYYQQIHQPMLEHEFIELFVRVVAERQVRLGESLNLYQAVEKVLALHILPFSSNPDLRKNEFYQQFYEQTVQDLLRGRPNKADNTIHEKLENIWLDFPKIKSMKKAMSLVRTGGIVLLQEFVKFVISLKDKSYLVAELTEAQIIRCIFGLAEDADYDQTVVLRKIHYEDFLEYLCRIIYSNYWIKRNIEIASGEEKLNDDEFAVIQSPLENPSQDEESQKLFLRLSDWLQSS